METPQLTQSIKEQTHGLAGVYTFTKTKIETPEQEALMNSIVTIRNQLGRLLDRVIDAKKRGDIKAHERLAQIYENAKAVRGAAMDKMIRYLHSISAVEKMVYKNLIPTVGRTMIANNLADATPDNTMLINKFELGTGVTAPANGDTALQTPVHRNNVASITNSSNIAYITGFVSAAEDADTYREAGLYSNGSGSLGNGILVSRVAINVTKSLTETLTIDWELTIT